MSDDVTAQPQRTVGDLQRDIEYGNARIPLDDDELLDGPLVVLHSAEREVINAAHEWNRTRHVNAGHRLAAAVDALPKEDR